MKIQCNACEVAEAKVLCCSDEAALCWGCDQKIHAGNKLASKHQRVPLSSPSSPMPKCDICQETVGYFFCLEDRALLCRKCDVAIHTANSYVSSHQRFLFTGMKVELEATELCISSSTKVKLSSVQTVSESASSRSITRSITDHFSTGEIRDTTPMQIGGTGTLVSDKKPLNQSTTSTSAGTIPRWHSEEYQNYGCLDTMPSKVYGSYCASVFFWLMDCGDELTMLWKIMINQQESRVSCS